MWSYPRVVLTCSLLVNVALLTYLAASFGENHTSASNGQRSPRQTFFVEKKNRRSPAVVVDDTISTTASWITPIPTTIVPSITNHNICPPRLAYLMPCWILGDNTCYCFSLFTNDWRGAVETCQFHNTSLISLETLEEKQMILNHVAFIVPELKGYAYWTSGRYNATASAWQWSSPAPQRLFEGTSLMNLEGIGGYYPYDTNKRLQGKCIVFNHQVNYIHLTARNCASYGYRFVCERALT